MSVENNDVKRGVPWKTALSQMAPLVGLFAVWGLFAILEMAGVIESGYFLSLRNHRQILITTAVVGTAAVGATCIIILGEIDLSVGSAIALATVIMALLINAGVPPLGAVVLGIIAGALIGLSIGSMVVGYMYYVVPLVCGLVTTVFLWKPLIPVGAIFAGIGVTVGLFFLLKYALKQLPMPSFIITLALWGGLRGTAVTLGNEQMVNIDRSKVDVTWVDNLLSHPTAPIPIGVWMFLVTAVIIALMLKYTVFGRHIYAIGSNSETARLCGVNVNSTKMIVFAIAGALAALAGLMQFSYLYATGDPTTATGYELNVIAAVVIGGASLSGGSGSILGTIAGALIMTVVTNGCVKLGIPNSRQMIVTGAIIMAAVALDQLRHRKAN